MAKISNFIKSWVQIFFLAIVFSTAWILFSFVKLFKSNEEAGKKGLLFEPSTLLIPKAEADIPGVSTPFIATWNGKKFELENDFLFGKPRNFFPTFEEGRKNYEQGLISADLYKIQNPMVEKNGNISLQIQEIEPEESFINGMSLLRIIHPKNTEVVTDSNGPIFKVIDKESLEKNFIAPDKLEGRNGEDFLFLASPENIWNDKPQAVELKKDEDIYLSYRNLDPSANYYIFLRSFNRSWVPGFVKYRKASLFGLRFPVMRVLGGIALLVLSAISKGKLLPLMILCESAGSEGSGSGSEGGSGACAGCSCGASEGSSSGCSLHFSYKNNSEGFNYFNTFEPRGWKYSVDMGALPKEAINESGEIQLKIHSTDSHSIAFMGLIRELNTAPFEIESLAVKQALHKRLNANFASSLRFNHGLYMHTVQGDTVDVQFKNPQQQVSVIENVEKETYLLRSAGFYTFLSNPYYKKILENEVDDKIAL